jgi:hypothetical protein
VAANLVAIIGGILVFHEPIGSGTPEIGARAVAFCLVIAGTAPPAPLPGVAIRVGSAMAPTHASSTCSRAISYSGASIRASASTTPVAPPAHTAFGRAPASARAARSAHSACSAGDHHEDHRVIHAAHPPALPGGRHLTAIQRAACEQRRDADGVDRCTLGRWRTEHRRGPGDDRGNERPLCLRPRRRGVVGPGCGSRTSEPLSGPRPGDMGRDQPSWRTPKAPARAGYSGFMSATTPGNGEGQPEAEREARRAASAGMRLRSGRA